MRHPLIRVPVVQRPGSVRPIKGALSMAMAAAKSGIPKLMVPAASAREAAVVKAVAVYGISSLAEAVGIRFITAYAIAPGAGRLDIVVMFPIRELRSFEPLRDRSEPFEQRLASGDDEAGMAAQHLRIAARQMELAAPDIDPHVAVGDHQVRVARQPESGSIEQRGETLVGDLDVDVLEVNRVAEVLGGAIE